MKHSAVGVVHVCHHARQAQWRGTISQINKSLVKLNLYWSLCELGITLHMLVTKFKALKIY